MKKQWKKIDKMIQQEILKDKQLHNFLKQIFNTREARIKFISKCLNKTKTRRMLLRAQWYTEIANDQKRGSALRLIFLIGMAEGIAKKRIGKPHFDSFEAIKEFFKYITIDDKNRLLRGFRRTELKPRHHKLKFSSVLRILYNVRNSAVHGEDYFSFTLMSKKDKEEESRYDHFSLMTFGYLGKRRRKKRESLSINLTYEELRDIFGKTAIENIKLML